MARKRKIDFMKRIFAVIIVSAVIISMSGSAMQASTIYKSTWLGIFRSGVEESVKRMTPFGLSDFIGTIVYIGTGSESLMNLSEKILNPLDENLIDQFD